MVSTDFLPDLDVKLQTGAMAAESGGHYADPFFAFLMVYNAIKGNYETSTEGFYNMVFPYMFVASPDDYANYAKYFTGCPARSCVAVRDIPKGALCEIEAIAAK